MDFKNIIIAWYMQNRRDLPWRKTSNPYHIWVSEIILQQTRVAQGIDYYWNFIMAFPTIKHLADASEDEVLKIWQGLGYYSRARNMHEAAKVIMMELNGKLPSKFSELIKIKGIGAYSAGAIASFAFKEPVPAIDGNVYRIIARIFGVFASPQTAKGKKEFNDLVSELMDKQSPDIFNQALLDFGALQCVPKSPSCPNCPFSQYCYAYRNNVLHNLPVKAKRIIPKNRYFTYVAIRCGYFTYINKRKSKDIWRSLYEFPLIETEKLPQEHEIELEKQWKKLFGKNKYSIEYISPLVKHQLSHQTLYTRFVVVHSDDVTTHVKKNYMKVLAKDIDNYSTPKLIDNFLAAEPAAKYFHQQSH